MRKLCKWILVVGLFIVMLECTVVIAESSGTWGNLNWSLSDNGYLIVSGRGKIDSFKYDSSNAWRAYKTEIKTVMIQDGVTGIGTYAFAGCSNLSSITIPDSVTTVGGQAFLGCSSLNSVVLPNSVSSIDAYAFSSCSNLSQILIPDSVTFIGYNAFNECISLTHITIPPNVSTINTNVFYGCSSLISITIPDSVKSIGERAFAYCSSLSSITMSDSVTSIGNNAFAGCSNLINIAIPNSVTNIGDNAFYRCSSLTSISVPISVTSIGAWAFSYCSSLSNVSIPDSLTSIGNHAFYSCDNLPYVTVSNIDSESAKLVSKISFYYSTAEYPNFKFQYIFNEDTITGLTVFSANTDVDSITIPESVTTIGNYAFKNCKMSSVTIPNSVTSIGTCAFSNCENLTSITIPNSIKSIGDMAFTSCTNLNNVMIMDDVTNISSSAFTSCNNLPYITVNRIDAESARSVSKASYSFYTATYSDLKFRYTFEDDTVTGLAVYSANKDVTNIVIPYGVTSIGVNAFYGCNNLSSIILPDSVISIGSSAFSGCNLPYITVSSINASTARVVSDASLYFSTVAYPDLKFKYSNSSSSGLAVFAVNKNMTSIVIPNDVTSIGSSAFSGCSRLTSITIPQGVYSIGDNAFNGCSSLASISVPDNVKSIGILAFSGCSSLANITIPEGVTSIGYSAFSGCKNLSHFSIPNAMTSINASVFAGCSSLISITIPYKVTSIGKSAFSGCSVLFSIRIPDAVTIIEDSAFSGCNILKNIYYDGTAEEWSSISIADNNEPLTKAELHFSIGHGSWGKLKWRLTDNGNLIISGIGQMDDFTDSSSAWHAYASEISTVTIDAGVMSIGNYAFDSCSSMTSITIPNSVTNIANYAFNGCSNLYNITLPNGVSRIGNYAFSGCVNLTRVTVPEGTTSIGEYAFANCPQLNRIFLLGTTTTFGDNPFDTDIKPTIFCYEFTDADSWATENNYPMIYLDNYNPDNDRTITLLENSIRLAVGNSKTITPSIYPDYDHPVITWTSSNPSVVSVKNGILEGVSAGSSSIIATIGSVSASMEVTVFLPATGMHFNEPEIWTVAKEPLQLSLVLEPENAEAILNWNSSDTSVAAISEAGTLITKKPGDITITVISDNELSANLLLHVCYPVTAISFEENPVTIKAGKAVQLTANVTMRTQSCDNHLVNFTSSTPSVATVDDKGLVTGITAGETTITATATSGVTASCSLIVLTATRLILPASTTTIESEAFANLPGVDIIELPASVQSIANDAFSGCDITLTAPAGSYAETWAQQHGVDFIAK